MTLTQEDFSVSDIRDVSRKVQPLVTEKKFTSALSVLPCYVADPGHMVSYLVRVRLNQLRLFAVAQCTHRRFRGIVEGSKNL